MNIQTTSCLPGSYIAAATKRPLVSFETDRSSELALDSLALDRSKASQPFAMPNPDSNGDGRVTAEEWAEVRGRHNVLDELADQLPAFSRKDMDWVIRDHLRPEDQPLIPTYRPLIDWARF